MIKILIFVGILILPASWAESAPAVVQLKTTTRTLTSDSKTLAFDSAVGSGRLIVACASWYNVTGSPFTVTDDVNAGSYSAGFSISDNGNQYIACMYKENVTAGTTSVTLNPTGMNADMDLTLFEISGVSSGSTIDVSAVNSGAFDAAVGGTTSVSTGTLAQGDEIIISSFSHNSGTATLTGDSGDSFTQAYENENTATGQTVHMQYKITSVSTALTVNGTIGTGSGSPTSTWFTGVVSFKGGAPDTQAPTDPSSFVATVTGSSTIALTWTASTDDVGIQNYRVERCSDASCNSFVEIATPSSNSYNDNGLTFSTLYRYRVRAYDGTNFSNYASIAEGTTLALQQATVSWVDENDTPDNEEHYVVQRKTGPGGVYADINSTAANATSYVDTASPTSTTGSSACYQVKAIAASYVDSVYSTEACSPAVASSSGGSGGVRGIGAVSLGVRFR